MMQRYCEYTLRFAHQTAACNTLHTIKQRACRWLLLVQDRAGTEQFALPQSILAEMLGVRRQSISEVASWLRRKGLIEYRRGHITIVNRKKLEAAACCECYGVMNAYYHRLLPRGLSWPKTLARWALRARKPSIAGRLDREPERLGGLRVVTDGSEALLSAARRLRALFAGPLRASVQDLRRGSLPAHPTP